MTPAFAPTLEVRAVRREDGLIVLAAPRPGLWRNAPTEGDWVAPGSSVGALEVLGGLYRLVAPRSARGVVRDLPGGPKRARIPVDFGAQLMLLDPNVVGAQTEEGDESLDADTDGPVFRTPLGGRFYARPAPDQAAFVSVGDHLKGGETVALIEVMKTFNRVKYEGDPAVVRAVLVEDGADLEADDPLLALEPA